MKMSHWTIFVSVFFFIVRKRGIPEIIPWKTMLEILIKGVSL